MPSVLKHFTFREVFEKLTEVAEVNGSSTDKLYIEMHAEALKDLLLDPDLDSYLNLSRATIVAREQIERIMGARIFTHTDSSKRFIMTITYRTDVIMSGDNA